MNTALSHPDLPSALRSHFGFPSFRVGQHAAIEHALARRDTLVVMPTGSGKSLCYQLPALLLDGTTIVISPLIALMKDQVDALTASSKRATFVNSTLASNEQRERLAGIARGDYKIVYVAPERLRNADFLNALRGTRVELFAVDEAHCISQWGHDFRPDYMHLREFIPKIGKPPVFALTATATPQVQDDIVQQLGLARAERIVTGFNRPNLSFAVHYTPSVANKFRELKTLLDGRDSSIIYTGTRREAEEVAEFVNEVAEIRAAFYHAGLEDDERARVQDDFMRGKIPVIVATNAFGMGVDKPDIRAVIHFNLPATVEAYYQEVGRAGRDDKPARGVLLYSPEDRALQEWFIENDAPKPEQTLALYRTLPRGVSEISPLALQRETGMNDTLLKLALRQLEIAGAVQRLGDQRGTMVLQVASLARLDLSASNVRIERFRAHKRKQLAQMIRYAEMDSCRRRFILDYFGDHGSADAPDCCDNHVAKTTTAPTRVATTEADSVALTVLDCVRALSGHIGRLSVSKVLAGSHAQDVARYQHRPFFGKLAQFKQRELDDMVNALIQQGYIKVIGGEYPVVTLSPLGANAIKTRAAIPLNLPQTTRKAEHARAERAMGTIEYTHHLSAQGLPPAEIAKARGLTIGTIYDHLAQLIEQGLVSVDAVIPQDIQAQIRAAMSQAGAPGLTAIKLLLPETISYGELRCVRAASNFAQNGPIVAQKTGDLGNDRVHTIWKLGESRSKENIATLIQALDDPSGNARRIAASALGKIEDESAVGPLMELLSDPKPQVRQYAIKALGKIGHPAAVQALTRIKDDPEEKEYNRSSAAAALRNISLNKKWVGKVQSPAPVSASTEDAVEKFLSTARSKPLRGPWRVGFALDFNSKFAGARWERTELGELVYRFKYGNESAAADAIAARLADLIRAHAEMKTNLVIPIPSTKKERPYDPVPLLARALGKQIGIAVNETTLVKTRATELQKTMTNLAQKQANVQGAFRVADANAVRGKHVLLLDDFFDSGATLAEATRVVQAAGAAEVYVLTVTKTIHAD